jgi:hypothetical protein
MTDEEMAEEYADRTRIVDENTKVGTDCISLVQDYEGNVIDIHERIKRAFLAGLKAGRPEWHKVADGNLPKNNRLVFIQMVNGNTTMGIHYENAWREICNCKELTGVIAWCEIPKYTEE